MKGKRLLVSLILGLGLTLALCLTLSARQDAQAAPPQAGVRQELALFPLERQDPELAVPSTAPYWRDMPVTTRPIENPDDLPGGAWDKIQAQLQRNSYELAPGSDPLLTSQTAKRTAADGAAEDLFGSAVAVSGDTIVVGAYQNDENGPNSGSAYVFTRNEGGMNNWGQTAKITATDGATDDQFGYAVAVSGDTIVVGARWDNDHGVDSGSAYVFTRNEGGPDNWGQTTKITVTDGAGEDEFGYAIAVSGDAVVVGARYDDDNGEDSGSAYIFTRNTGGADNWGQATKITADDRAQSDYFG